MDIQISNKGYYRMTIECCEQDLKDIRQIMHEASEETLGSVERRAVAHRIVALMDKQREMPQ